MLTIFDNIDHFRQSWQFLTIFNNLNNFLTILTIFYNFDNFYFYFTIFDNFSQLTTIFTIQTIAFAIFDNWKDNPGDLWNLRRWQFSQLRTWIHNNLCYLTINCDTGQHSQWKKCEDEARIWCWNQWLIIHCTVGSEPLNQRAKSVLKNGKSWHHFNSNNWSHKYKLSQKHLENVSKFWTLHIVSCPFVKIDVVEQGVQKPSRQHEHVNGLH